MKQTLLFSLLLSCFILPLRAQQVFIFEMESSARNMRAYNAGFLPVRIACFQNAALTYLQQKATTSPATKSAKWLDNQAFHLADFLALYHALLTDESLGTEETPRIKQLFREATLAFPCFEDSNAAALRFVDNPNTDTTPFSLDTDWEKAFHSIFDRKDIGPYRERIDEFTHSSRH